MAEEKKNDQDSKQLENLSLEELQERIQKSKKKIRQSIGFAAAAVAVIVVVCAAWFVSNNNVSFTGTGISAESDEPFLLASVGSRQTSEKEYLKNDQNENILMAGNEKEYDQYIDIATGSPVTGKKTYYTGTSGFAWYLSGQESLSPGAGGKLEFYLIPRKSGLKKAAITLTLTGYEKNGNNKAATVKDERLQRLLSGHILLFQNLDDTYGYSGWLGKENTFTVTAPKLSGTDTGSSGSPAEPEEAEFKKDVPYKVTIYWKWPQYFRNYIYTRRSTEGDLFTDKTDQSPDSEYTAFIQFVDADDQKKMSSSRLFCNTSSDGTDSAAEIQGMINNQMSDELLNTCSKYYNQADEYIGSKAHYIYIEMEVAQE